MIERERERGEGNCDRETEKEWVREGEREGEEGNCERETEKEWVTEGERGEIVIERERERERENERKLNLDSWRECFSGECDCFFPTRCQTLTSVAACL